MEENTIQNNVTSKDYSDLINKLIESNINYKEDFKIINKNIEDIFKIINSEVEKNNLEKKKIDEEKQKELKLLPKKEEEDKKIQQQQQQKEDTFLKNIEDISKNTNTETVLKNQEILVQALDNINVLTQVNIMCSGLMFGVICIMLFSKFFKK